MSCFESCSVFQTFCPYPSLIFFLRIIEAGVLVPLISSFMEGRPQGIAASVRKGGHGCYLFPSSVSLAVVLSERVPMGPHSEFLSDATDVSRGRKISAFGMLQKWEGRMEGFLAFPSWVMECRGGAWSQVRLWY